MSHTRLDKNIWLVIPASGIGSRMQSSIPKQYLPLQHKTVIEITLDRLLSSAHVSGAVVVINKNDAYWKNLNYSNVKPVLITEGGDERSDSVLNGLKMLKENHQDSNLWVMIHDAVRPCISHIDINKLVDAAHDARQGLFLAHPVADTLKKSNHEQKSIETIDRSSLWRAFTPQMFSFALIYKALKYAIGQDIPVTDDASAIESIGLHPKIILGRSDNIKITYPQDILIAAMILKNNAL